MNIRVSFTQRVWFVSLIALQILLLSTEIRAQNRDCRIGSFFNGRRCRRCRPGTFQDAVGSTSCKQCRAGTFTASRGVISDQLCLDCPEDSNSAPGARKCFKCPRGEVRRCAECKRCPKGSFFNGCDCDKCFDGTITTEDNQSECTECPPGMRSNRDRTKCIDGGCPPGFQFYSGECLPCTSVEFSYLNFKNETTGLCQPCSSRTTVLDFQAPEKGCEQCPPGEFLTDIIVPTDFQLRGCERCPPGTRTVGFGKPLCREIGKPCPDNTFEDEDGDCQICDPGFRFDPKNKRCVECRSNEVLRGPELVHLFTKCRKCAPGQIRQFDLCACRDGEVFRNGRCRICPAGTYASGGECTPCDSNEFSGQGATICTPCPPGTTSAGSGGRRCERIRCKKGLIIPPLFVSSFPERTCISPVTGCPRGLRGLGFKSGTFLCADRKGEVVCPKGSVFDGNDECISCSPGWRIVETESGGLTCRPCPDSRPISDGGTTRTCRACKNGFQASFGSSKCFCGSGRFIAKNGRCRRCPDVPFPQLPLECIFL